jgi:hypothetical protein
MTHIPRDIIDVIEQLHRIIPEDGNERLLLRVNKIARDSTYRPPELKYLSWELLTEALDDAMPPFPEHEWQYEVCSLLSTKSIETIKNEIAEWKVAHGTV